MILNKTLNKAVLVEVVAEVVVAVAEAAEVVGHRINKINKLKVILFIEDDA